MYSRVLAVAAGSARTGSRGGIGVDTASASDLASASANDSARLLIVG